MAQRKNHRKPIALRPKGRPLGLRVATFPMQPTATGVARRIRIEFPLVLTTQEKYDVATALAKAASVLVAEADLEARPASFLEEEPTP